MGKGRLFAVVILVVAAVAVVLIIIGPRTRHNELNVMNWDFYIGETTIPDFERA